MSHVDDGKLHAYLDGECSDRERQQLEDHLADCGVCRERLEEAKTSSQRVSDLLGKLEPAAVQAPGWGELEGRAAARKPSGASRTWVRPSLAWAAVIALAFGVGWLSNSYMSNGPERFGAAELQDEATGETSSSENELEEGAPATVEPPAAVATGAPEDRPETVIEDARRPQDLLAASRQRTEAIPAERSVDTTAGRTEVDEGVVAGAETEQRLAEAPRRDQEAEAKEELKGAVAKAEPRAAALADRQTPEIEGAREPLAQPAAANVPDFDEASPDQFVGVSTDDAAAWMGAEVRTLPELQLVSTEVGPGIAVAGGVPGLPAIKLTYLDAAGHVVVLIQQQASRIERLGEGGEPTLIVDPTGLNAYRWHDGQGYRFILLGEVSGDSLRALAERVR